MKRFNKTAVALATAGAMTLAIVPNASAQVWDPANPNDDYFNSNNEAPSIGDLDPKQASNDSLDKPANGEKRVDDPANPVGAGAPATSIDELRNDPNAVGENGKNLQRQEDEKGYKRTEADGTEAKMSDFGDDVKLGVDQEANVDGLRPADPTELKPEDVFKEDGTVDKDKLKKVLIGLGAAAGVLTIAGIVYKIVKNSKGEPVLVPADRADQTPTAADEAKTQELLENNAAEIAAQAGAADATTGDAATADRGVGAATGNNTIAKGLVGLLIASIMGAAAFAFGRRRLV